jgi:multiple sugar transport system substrate-binding protein
MSKISYTRRQVCQLGLSSLAGMAMLDLAACGGSTTTTTTTGNNSNPNTTLQLSFWGAASRNKLTQAAIKAYQKDGHSNTKINSWFAAFSTYFTKLNTQIASGTSPDLIQMDMGYVKQYADEKQILDLTSLVNNKTFDLSDFDQTLLADSEYNGVLYGIPLGGNYECMLYNSTVVQEAGVGAPPTTWTWDEFASYAGKISKALSSKQIYGSSDASGAMDMFEIWVRSNGHDLYTASGQAGFTQDDVQTWFEYWDAMRKAGSCAPAQIQATDTTAGPATALISKGKTAFATAHSNQFSGFQTLVTDPLMLQFVPTGKQTGNYLKCSMMMSIAANSKNTDEAAKFIQFLITNPDGVKAIGLDRGIPGSARAIATLTPKLKPADQAVINYAAAIVSNKQSLTKTILDPAAASKVLTDLGTVSQSVGFGKLSPAAGASQFFQNAQKTLAGA